MRLAGRRVLITGAASGIGRACAELFAGEGAALALLDRNDHGLSDFDAIPCPADVTAVAAVGTAVAAAVAGLGGLDGVVNCAGKDMLGRLTEVSPEAWAEIINVNLTGSANVCRAAIPSLRAAGTGTIVNVASGAGLFPLPDRTAYCAAKAGLVMFSKSLAMEVADSGIRVNAVCPGAIDTPMLAGSYQDAPDPAAEKAMIQQRYLLRRFGEASEIAAAILFLSSAEASYITGTAMAVDGGRTFY
ncbi:MAG: SDR family NAD(P)-dependent oxidoreductase [Alphaproteobacteria bacterium]|nr:SDR family NAD(P)-dependent oxidoreductase [Alphaproteobacteria bacterium]